MAVADRLFGEDIAGKKLYAVRMTRCGSRPARAFPPYIALPFSPDAYEQEPAARSGGQMISGVVLTTLAKWHKKRRGLTAAPLLFMR